MTHVTCRLTAKNRDQLRNPTLGNLYLFTTGLTLVCWYLVYLVYLSINDKLTYMQA